MDQFKPHLPIELTDSIINEVGSFPDKRARSEALSSFALASPTYRQQVNKLRFEKINIHSIEDIHAFSHLLRTDTWPQEDQTVRSCIRNVDVELLDDWDSLNVALNDGDMAFILQSLYRRYTRDKAPSLPFSFSWEAKVGRYNDNCFWSWKSLCSDVQSALKTLLLESCLTDLSIYSLSDIPNDFLHGSHIQQFHFTDITFDRRIGSDFCESTEGVLDSWHLKNVSTFITNHSTSPLHYIGNNLYSSSQLSAPGFSNLTTLILCICNDEEYKMTRALMERTTTLKRIAFSLPDSHELPGPLCFDHLELLEIVEVVIYNPLRPRAPDYLKFVHDIVDCLRPAIPLVRSLIFKFSIVSTNDQKTDYASIFGGHNFSAMDAWLAESLPPTVKTVEIHLSVAFSLDWDVDNFIEQFRREGGKYARRLFPRLAKSKTSRFSVQIDVTYAYHDIEQSHYSSSPGYRWKVFRGFVDYRGYPITPIAS
ncbi:hypothetical protein BDN70DRAFT_519304 [Pholiota conissans]|uniref:Uncharacterized protein n=1 Tax=Pholiota conissans TaxID=109636 RepID=A0A9P5Z503_9AGAR|nr:hypothetical protein BDN70DRAFT_519304 [Pholiota conissans]